jgi:threonine aldolase
MGNKKSFASDNNSGVHPEIMNALINANEGHQLAYGNDEYTLRAKQIFEKEFGDNIDVYFVFNGTGANVLALSALTSSWNAVICADAAHIYVDECGAPEKATGCKLIPVPAIQGKITPAQIEQQYIGIGDEHHVQPRVVSITQSTEFATVYTLEEIKAICDTSHRLGMYVHMDGARLANAAVSMGLDFRAFTRDAGVDVLSFGGTKNGMMMGEAVIFFNKALSANAKYFRKQHMQLNSKMRYVSAQFEAYFKDDLWKKTAAHANAMAHLLYENIKDIKEIEVLNKVESNGIFARIPREITPALQEKYFFYVFNEHENIVRWMCSFDTTAEDISNFSKFLKEKIV